MMIAFSGARKKTRLFVAVSLSLVLLVATNMVALANNDDGIGPNTPYMRIFKGVNTAARTAGTPLRYQGGSVLTASKVYINWWGSQWNSGFATGGYSSAQAQTYIRGFFNNVGGSNWNNIDTQYCQGVAVGTINCGTSGTHITNPTSQLKGEWVDTTSVPTRPTQAQIQSAAARLMSHFGGYDPNAIYFVFTPTGHSMSGFGTSWCAWHDEPTSGTDMAYAYMPYLPDVGATCGRNFVNPTNDAFGNGYFDGFSIVGGHEFAEAVTDPHPERTSVNFGWITSTGSTGQENGDLCAWASNSTNITLGTNHYAVQPIWSNQTSSCVTS
jgi:serine protease